MWLFSKDFINSSTFLNGVPPVCFCAKDFLKNSIRIKNKRGKVTIIPLTDDIEGEIR